MKAKLANVLIALTILFSACAACGNKENQSQTDDFVVELSIPGSVDVYAGGIVTLPVSNGKALKSGDAIVLTGADGVLLPASVLESTAEKVSFRLPSSITVSGSYKIIVKRGTRKKELGTLFFNIVKPIDFAPDPGSTIYGQVSCNDKGVSGVVVSDGVEVVKTDSKGYYQIKSKKERGYVFVSVPSGYDVPTDGILPKLHYNLKNKGDKAGVQERADFELKVARSQEKFKLLVFGDMHLAKKINDLKQYEAFMSDVTSYQQAHSSETIYGLTLGDMTWDLYWVKNKYGFPEYLTTINSGIKNLCIYHTMGNHDNDMVTYSDITAEAPYTTYIAPTYYSYNIGNWHFVVLDDIDCSGYDGTDKRLYVKSFTSEQLDWLRKDLAEVDASTPLVISTHAQIFYPSGTGFTYDAASSRYSNTRQLLDIVSGRKTHFFTGHTHIVYNVNQQESVVGGRDVFEHNSGAVCGTWWWTSYYAPGIHIGQDGSPGGYQIVDFDGTDIKWQFKATGKSEDYQFRTYDRNQMDLSISDWAPGVSDKTGLYATEAKDWTGPSTDNYVYFNVWNYNPEWTIDVTENGTKLSVSRVGIYDPLHFVTYVVPLVKEGSTSAKFHTVMNYHSFRVKASSANSTLEFNIKDEFGNTYKETMKRPKPFKIDNY